MPIIGKIIAGIIIIVLLGSELGNYVWIPVTIIILWYLIRWGADIYWWNKDKDEW